jgi:hypothetical protein
MFWRQSVGFNNQWTVLQHEVSQGRRWVLLELHAFDRCEGSCCRPQRFFGTQPLGRVGLKLPSDRGWNSWRIFYIRAFNRVLLLRWVGPLWGTL